jgi:hypothetical protein
MSQWFPSPFPSPHWGEGKGEGKFQISLIRTFFAILSLRITTGILEEKKVFPVY